MADSPFDHLVGRDRSEEIAAHAAADFETRLVRRVLTHLKLNFAAQLAKKGREATGRPCMLFDHFHEELPEYPFRFRAAYEPLQSRQTRISDVFKRLDQLAGAGALLELIDEVEGTQWENSCGVVVPWGGVPNGLVFHNSGFAYNPERGSRICWFFEDDVRLVVEPFQQLLKNIVWSN